MQSRYANEQFTGTTIIMIKMRIRIVIQDENPSCTSVSLQQTYDPKIRFSDQSLQGVWPFNGYTASVLWW